MALIALFRAMYIQSGSYARLKFWTSMPGCTIQVSSRRWHQLKDLPQPLPCPSATICGNQLHVIGSNGNGYSCSLQALLSSDRPITSQLIPHLISWTSLPPLPVEYSTAATLSGQLVIIGGGDRPSGKTNSSAVQWTVGGNWVYVLW